MPTYIEQAEKVNYEWSKALAEAIASSRGLPAEEFEQFMRSETIELPYMLYLGMLELVSLNARLMPTLTGDRVAEAQGIIGKIQQLLSVFKALPAISLGVDLSIADQIDATVARLNGRWPL